MPGHKPPLLAYGKDWLPQLQDNVIEWDIMSWCWLPGLPVEQHYEVTMSARCRQVGGPSDMTVDVARTLNSNNQPTNQPTIN